jgi:hypothetical protein
MCKGLLVNVAPDQATDGLFDAQAKFYGQVFNEPIRFSADLKSAFRLNIHQFLTASLRFSVSPRFNSP